MCKHLLSVGLAKLFVGCILFYGCVLFALYSYLSLHELFGQSSYAGKVTLKWIVNSFLLSSVDDKTDWVFAAVERASRFGF